MAAGNIFAGLGALTVSDDTTRVRRAEWSSTNRSGSFLDSFLPITNNPVQDLKDFQMVRQLVQPVREPFDRGGTVIPVRPVDSVMRTRVKDIPSVLGYGNTDTELYEMMNRKFQGCLSTEAVRRLTLKTDRKVKESENRRIFSTRIYQRLYRNGSKYFRPK